MEKTIPAIGMTTMLAAAGICPNPADRKIFGDIM